MADAELEEVSVQSLLVSSVLLRHMLSIFTDQTCPSGTAPAAGWLPRGRE